MSTWTITDTAHSHCTACADCGRQAVSMAQCTGIRWASHTNGTHTETARR